MANNISPSKVIYYISQKRKILVGRNNQVNQDLLKFDYRVTDKFNFQVVNSINQIIPPTSTKYELFGSYVDNKQQLHILFFAQNDPVTGNTIPFTVDTYTSEFMNYVKIEKEIDLTIVAVNPDNENDKSMVLRDRALVYPRPYIQGRVPTQILQRTILSFNNPVSGLFAAGSNFAYIDRVVDNFSLGEGLYTDTENQLVIGSYNEPSGTTNKAFVIGNGEDNSNRSNAFTVDYQGNVEAKSITVDGQDVGDKVNQLENDIEAVSAAIPSVEGFATEQWVQEQGYLTAHQDLTAYATKDWVEGKGYITGVNLDPYATKDQLTAYATKSDLTVSASVLSNQISQLALNIPTKVSDLTNDAGYLTAVPTSYALKTDIPTGNAQLQNTAGYITGYNAGTGISISNGTISLTGEVGKTYYADNNTLQLNNSTNTFSIKSLSSKLNQGANILLTPQSDGSVTINAIGGGGGGTGGATYLAGLGLGLSTVSAEDGIYKFYVNEPWLDNKINTATSGIQNLSAGTGLEIEDNVISLTAEIPSIDGLASEQWVEANFLSAIPSNYATKDYVDSSVSGKADLSSVYTKEEVYTYIETDAKINQATSGKADLSAVQAVDDKFANYYTSAQVDQAIATAVEDIPSTVYTGTDGIKVDNGVISLTATLSSITNDAGFITSADIPTSYVQQNELESVSGQLTNAIGAKANTTDVEAEFTATSAWANETFLTEHQSLSSYYTKSEVDSAIGTATNDMATQSWVEEQGYLTAHQSLDDYYNKTQVDTAITNATSGKADQSTVESLSTALSTAIDTKANSADVYTKSQVYTKGEVDTAINTSTSGKVNKTDFDTVTGALSSAIDTKTTSAQVSSIVEGYNYLSSISVEYNDNSGSITGITLTDSFINGTIQNNKLELDWAGIKCTQGGGSEYFTEIDSDTLEFDSDSQHLHINIPNSYTEEVSGAAVEAVTGWVDDQNYLTEVPSEYITETELATELEPYAQSTNVTTAITNATSGKADQSTVESLSANLSAAITGVVDSLSSKANVSDVYTKTEVYTKGETDSAINTSTSGKADKSYVDSTFLSASQIADYYTSAQVETRITAETSGKVNKTDFDTVTGALSSAIDTKTTSGEVKTQIEAYGYQNAIDVANAISGKADKSELQSVSGTLSTAISGVSDRVGAIEADYTTSAQVRSIVTGYNYLSSITVSYYDQSVDWTTAQVTGIQIDNTYFNTSFDNNIVQPYFKGIVINQNGNEYQEGFFEFGDDIVVDQRDGYLVLSINSDILSGCATKTELQTASGALSTAISGVSDRVGAIEADYIKSADMTATSTWINSTFETKANVNNLTGRVKAIEDDYTTSAYVTGQVNALATGAVATNTANIGQLSTDLGTVSGKANANETAIGTLSTDLGTANGNISTLSTDLGTVSSKANTNADNISSLSTRIGTAEGNITTLSTDLGTTQNNITQLSTSVNTISTTYATTSYVNTVSSNLSTELTGWVAENTLTGYTAGSGLEITNDNVIQLTVSVIPSAVSQLVNDSNFITYADIVDGVEYHAGEGLSLINNTFALTGSVLSGDGSTIAINNNVISVIGGGGATYTAGEGIAISNQNVISLTADIPTVATLSANMYEATSGNIETQITSKNYITAQDIPAAPSTVYDKLSAGSNITLTKNDQTGVTTIAATGGGGGKTYTGASGVTVDNVNDKISIDKTWLDQNYSPTVTNKKNMLVDAETKDSTFELAYNANYDIFVNQIASVNSVITINQVIGFTGDNGQVASFEHWIKADGDLTGFVGDGVELVNVPATGLDSSKTQVFTRRIVKNNDVVSQYAVWEYQFNNAAVTPADKIIAVTPQEFTFNLRSNTSSDIDYEFTGDNQQSIGFTYSATLPEGISFSNGTFSNIGSQMGGNETAIIPVTISALNANNETIEKVVYCNLTLTGFELVEVPNQQFDFTYNTNATSGVAYTYYGNQADTVEVQLTGNYSLPDGVSFANNQFTCVGANLTGNTTRTLTAYISGADVEPITTEFDLTISDIPIIASNQTFNFDFREQNQTSALVYTHLGSAQVNVANANLPNGISYNNGNFVATSGASVTNGTTVVTTTISADDADTATINTTFNLIGHVTETLAAPASSLTFDFENDDTVSGEYTFTYTGNFATLTATVTGLPSGITASQVVVDGTSGTITFTGTKSDLENTTYNISVVIKTIDAIDQTATVAITAENVIPDYTTIPLTFTGKNASNAIKLTKTGSPPAITLQYSKNNGSWTTYNIGDTIEFNQGETVAFSGANEQFSTNGDNTCYKFATTGLIDLSGNIQSLLNFGTTAPQGCFWNLFNNCKSIVDASQLVFPATTLGKWSYAGMFYGNSNLTNASFNLPATQLYQACYLWMFGNCTSLTAVPPVLPATGLVYECYASMFNGCSNITDAPLLSGAVLANNSYHEMFKGCSKLSSISVAISAWNGSYTSNWVNGVASNGTFTCPTALGTNATITRGTSNCPSNWTVVNN